MQFIRVCGFSNPERIENVEVQKIIRLDGLRQRCVFDENLIRKCGVRSVE